MLKVTQQETNTLTTSVFRSTRKIIYVTIFLLVGWSLTHYVKSIIQEDKRALLYKLADNDEDGEYQEGAYWVYNIGTGESAILDKHILMDYTEAWHTVSNQYVVLDLMSIKVLDSSRVVVEEKKIDEEDVVIGGQYNSKLHQVFFLLPKGKTVNYTIGLYEFDLAK